MVLTARFFAPRRELTISSTICQAPTTATTRLCDPRGDNFALLLFKYELTKNRLLTVLCFVCLTEHCCVTCDRTKYTRKKIYPDKIYPDKIYLENIYPDNIYRKEYTEQENCLVDAF